MRRRHSDWPYKQYLELVYTEPGIVGKALQHRHEELKAAIPVRKQEHEAD